MYRLGLKGRAKAKKRTWRVLATIVVLVLVGGGVATYFILRSLKEEPTVPQIVTREFEDTKDNTTRGFEQGGFTINLPSDWVERDSQTTPYTRYSFQATLKNADNRWLDIYVDSAPTRLAFNRLLPVTVSGDSIVVSGSMSDNCANFSTPGVTPQVLESGIVLAKWQNIEFPCDMANYSRNLVGVGTEDTQNRVILTNAAGKTKTFIFVYTDHNVNPNYQIFEDALKSVKLL